MRIHLYLLAACQILTRKFSPWVYQSGCCHFWPIKSHTLSHVVIWVAFIFLGIYFFYHSFCLHDFKILVTLVKSRQGKTVPFHVLALFVCCWHLAEPEVLFSLNVQSFTFWIWMEEFWIWFIHISKFKVAKDQNLGRYIQCFFSYPFISVATIIQFN